MLTKLCSILVRASGKIMLDSNLYMFIINHALIFSCKQEPFRVKYETLPG